MKKSANRARQALKRCKDKAKRAHIQGKYPKINQEPTAVALRDSQLRSAIRTLRSGNALARLGPGGASIHTNPLNVPHIHPGKPKRQRDVRRRRRARAERRRPTSKRRPTSAAERSARRAAAAPKGARARQGCGRRRGEHARAGKRGGQAQGGGRPREGAASGARAAR